MARAAKQTKFVFVTGGMLSGVGKGITAASIGTILKTRGLSVNIQKCDPYLNVDAGTLNPAEHGEFDLVYLGSLLWHLRDPVLALERIRAVCRGVLVSTDAISLPLTLIPIALANLDGRDRPYWWKPNRKGYARLVEVAGFRLVSPPRLFLMPPGPGLKTVPINRASLGTQEGRELIFTSRFGDPHATLRAAPRRARPPAPPGVSTRTRSGHARHFGQP